MHGYHLRRFGREAIERFEAPDPPGAPGEMWLELRAMSLNRRDLLVATGAYDPAAPLPIIPGSDAVWTVRRSVPRGPAEGRRVITCFAPGWDRAPLTRDTVRSALGCRAPGVATSHRWALPEHVVEVDDAIDDATAATLPCAALTAWTALVDHGGVQPGNAILVQGSGGVSCWATVLAKSLGATVAAVSGRAERRDGLRALGADRTWDRADAWLREVPGFTGTGFDQVVEVAAGSMLANSLRALRPGGLLSLVGILDGHQATLDLLPIVMRGLTVRGVFVGTRPGLIELVAHVAAHRLTVPIVERPLSTLADALGALERDEVFGKLVLVPDRAAP